MAKPPIDYYINFVEEQIRKYRDKSKLIISKDIQPYLVNKTLAEYQDINLMLNAEYERAKTKFVEIQDAFQEWWDEVFLKAREYLNPLDRPATKWASIKEIEAYTRHNNKEQFRIWKRKLNDVDARMSFIKRLLDQWKKFDGILTTLSTNMRSELRALSIENRANDDRKIRATFPEPQKQIENK